MLLGYHLVLCAIGRDTYQLSLDAYIVKAYVYARVRRVLILLLMLESRDRTTRCECSKSPYHRRPETGPDIESGTA